MTTEKPLITKEMVNAIKEEWIDVGFESGLVERREYMERPGVYFIPVPDELMEVNGRPALLYATVKPNPTGIEVFFAMSTNVMLYADPEIRRLAMLHELIHVDVAFQRLTEGTDHDDYRHHNRIFKVTANRMMQHPSFKRDKKRMLSPKNLRGSYAYWPYKKRYGVWLAKRLGAAGPTKNAP